MTKRLSDYVAKVMLDSGAFTAWTRGAVIDVKDYIDYIKHNQQHLWTYINLDVIPPVGCSLNDIEEAAEQSYNNLQIMKKAGLCPIPVFHYREQMTWLERLVSDGEKYICLGGTVGLKDAVKKVWFENCIKVLRGPDRLPRVKVHGLGVGSHRQLALFPWQSVDFATWDKGAGNGQVPVPKISGGVPDWSQPPNMIKVSKSGEKHLERWGPQERRAAQAYMEQAGGSLGELRYRRVARERLWILYYYNLQKYLRARGRGWPHIKLVFCTSPSEGDRHDQLTQIGVRYRLMSYFEAMRMPQNYLGDYAKTGLEKDSKPYVRRGNMWKPGKLNTTYANFRRLALLERLARSNGNEETGSGGDSGNQEITD
jgi:hypothetical protein